MSPGPRARLLAATFSTTVVILCINLVTGIIIARGLGPDGRGELTALVGLPQFFGWLFALGSFQAIAYRQARRPDDAPRLIGTWLTILVPVGVLAVGLGEIFAPVLLGAQTTETIDLAHVYVLLTIFGVLSNLSQGIIIGDGDIRFFNHFQLAQTAGIAVGYLGLWQTGRLSVLNALIVTGVVLQLGFVALAVRVLSRHRIGRPSRELARSTTWFGARAYATDISGVANVRLDLTIIPAVVGAALVGYYAIAAAIAGIFITLTGSLSRALLSMAARDQDGGPRVVLRTTMALIATCGTLAAGVWIFAPQAISLVYGDDFSASVTPLRIILPGAVLYGAAAVVAQGLTALNRPFTAAAGQITGLVITVVGLALFLPSGGIDAAAATSLVAYVTVFAVSLALYLRQIRRQGLSWRGVATAEPASPGPGSPLRAIRAPAVALGAVGAVVVVAAIFGLLLTSSSGVRLAVGGALLAGLAGLGAVSMRALVPALMIWLAALGMVRRMLTEFAGSTQFDLLLLVGPSIIVVLVVGAHVTRRSPGSGTTFTRLVLLLALLTLVAAVNPLNESLTAGAGGLLFVLIPLLAYWIGLRIDDRTLKAALGVVTGLAVLVAGYGLYQQASGFPSWDRAWIESSGYAALSVAGTIRSFGSFSSAAEYGVYMGVGLVVVLALALSRARYLPLVLPVIALLSTAIFLASARGIIFKLVAAIGLMAAARARVRMVPALVGAVVLILLVPSVVSRIAPEQSNNALVAHQVEGLSDPTNEDSSTLDSHTSVVFDAIGESIRDPLGTGLSHVTISGERFSGQSDGSRETDAAEGDIETAAVAMGIPGLAVFLAIFALGFVRLYRLARENAGFLELVALGILTVTVLQWLKGGQYAVCILPWLFLGWAEARRASRAEEAAPAAVPEPRAPLAERRGLKPVGFS